MTGEPDVEQHARARVVAEVVLVAAVAWVGWLLASLLVLVDESDALLAWSERMSDALAFLAWGLLPLTVWVVPTLGLGLALRRHRPLRLAAGVLVALLLVTVPLALERDAAGPSRLLVWALPVAVLVVQAAAQAAVARRQAPD